MGDTPLISDMAHQYGVLTGAISISALLCFIAYEWLMDRYSQGRKNRYDWSMAALSLGFLGVVQRPLLTFTVFFLMTLAFPGSGEALRWLDQDHFWISLLIFLLIDEYLHGRAHLFAHSPKPKAAWLQAVQSFYKTSHRPHHLLGGNDGRGELSATQTYVEHWGWWLILPNYWFGLMCLYLGLYETFLWGTVGKAIWGMHVHTNWGNSYDRWLLKHPNRLISGSMRALCHVLVFPTQHQQHHSRSANSAKNMTNMIAIYDWLLWDTLVIETDRPETYGWRQQSKEEHSALHRFFHTPSLKQRGNYSGEV